MTDAARARMVQQDLARRGIRDPEVLAAMGRIPRERFVPPALTHLAYADQPLDIGQGQTISQPYIVALMTEAARVQPDDRVLEVGTGSGYQTAVLAAQAAHVDSIERLPAHVAAARRRLADLGITNVTLHTGDGAAGLPGLAPFDVIVVTAAAPHIPPALREQVAVGGRLVIPIGDRDRQRLTRLERSESGYVESDLGAVRFVPLISPDAFPS